MAGRHRRLAALTLAALALTGCASSAPRETVTPSPAPTTVAPTAEAVPTWPLTGVPGEDAEERPAVAVKVENTAMARPQTGLEEADVVWEEMVEGGITRFNAVFHSRLPEVVGPIRSVRPMDAGIVAPLGGPQVISGGQPLFLGSVQEAGVQLISHDAGHAGFFRSADRRAPHNLYGRLPELLTQAEAAEPPPEQFSFAADGEEATAVLEGEPATALRLSFPQTSPGWTWDGGADRWLRDEAGEPATSVAGDVLGAENVVVMRVEVVASEGRDQSGDAVPETVMTGTGEALVASGGRVVPATWSKAALGEPVTLTTAAGDDVALAPGTTWVELVPVDRGGVDVQR
ncbi:Protein of unknown function [Georgenia satyanarayanai]|uniref:DUF3048 domain-containing protein n=1 Tax=Georgenia satyanarayanai TaxID=860221 RepID=A0A2Y9ADM9_9MICO|nr:DUF3048 domain-containing protein [Georgenia satyanarayanai]PYF99575.1 Protein of unknown function (DUF3048) [Georgenia satyanarayanai]SSA42420.1 Protein of unknown function [Georgenia satyanarayanai]